MCVSFSGQAIKKHKNFNYLQKFDPDIPNSFEDIIYEKLETLQRLYRLINFFVPASNFAAVSLCYCLQRAES